MTIPAMTEANATPLELGAHTTALFATPVVRYHWPDSEGLNQQLRTLILEREKVDRGDAKNLINGWSSSKDMTRWTDPATHQLIQRFYRAAHGLMRVVDPQTESLRQLQLEAWANVSRNGAYHGVHSHPNSAWSGVYYVSVGTPADGHNEYNGQIELLDPRTAVDSVAYDGSPFTLRARIAPEPGMMLMFPSWLKHMVHAFYGSGERISVAFNFMPV